MSAIDDRPFPRAALIAAGALMLASVAFAGTVRVLEITHPNPAPDVLQTADIAPVSSAVLRFEALESGVVRVSDAASGALVREIGPSESGFIHGALRGMRRARMLQGLDLAPVLTVTRWSNGRVTVSDEATDFHLDLTAFGRDNLAAFAALLPPSAAPSPTRSAP